jgi:tetratricopeptide (TPR) repeat protein
VATCTGTESEPLERLLAQMGPSAGPRQLSHAERLAARSRGQPWLLVIDDIDHLSPPDREALTWLLRNSVAIEGEPLLVVAAALHKEGGALASGEATGLSVEKLVLGPLDRRSVVQLVRELGVGGSAGAVLGNRLHEELGGVPALIIEQVQAMARAGWLARAPEGGLRSTRSNDALRDDPLPRPERSGKGGDRLGRLDPVGRRVLDALCVLNLEATVDLVAEVAGLDVGSVERGISLLAGDGLARRWVDGMQELIGLGTMGRDALYGHVEPDLRAELHRNAAAALKRRARRRVGAMAEEMAGHLLCGGQMAEAWPLLVEAATRRARAGEVDEARRLMRQALDAGPAAEARLNPEEALRLRQSLHSLEGDLLERGGDLTGAQHAWERALDAAVERGDREGSARARAGLGLARVARGESLEARPLLERVLAELPPGDPHWGRVALALAEARLALDELEPAEQLWRQVEEQSRLTQAQGVQGEALLGRALCEFCRMEQRRALDHLTEAEDLLRAAGPAWALARCLLVLAEAALVDGRLIEAQDRAAEADRIARELPRPALLAWGQGLGAEILYARGRLDEGRLAAQEAAAFVFARCRGENLHQLYALCWVARPLCRAGAQEQAAALLPDPPLGLPPGLEDPAALCAGVRAWALAPFEARRAVQHAQQALFRSPGPRLPWLSARLAIDLCHALVEVGDPAAVGAAREAVGRTAMPGLRLLRLEALRLAARLEPALGWKAEADDLLQRIAQEQGAPAELISRWGSA